MRPPPALGIVLSLDIAYDGAFVFMVAAICILPFLLLLVLIVVLEAVVPPPFKLEFEFEFEFKSHSHNLEYHQNYLPHS